MSLTTQTLVEAEKPPHIRLYSLIMPPAKPAKADSLAALPFEVRKVILQYALQYARPLDICFQQSRKGYSEPSKVDKSSNDLGRVIEINTFRFRQYPEQVYSGLDWKLQVPDSLFWDQFKDHVRSLRIHINIRQIQLIRRFAPMPLTKFRVETVLDVFGNLREVELFFGPAYLLPQTVEKIESKACLDQMANYLIGPVQKSPSKARTVKALNLDNDKLATTIERVLSGNQEMPLTGSLLRYCP